MGSVFQNKTDKVHQNRSKGRVLATLVFLTAAPAGFLVQSAKPASALAWYQCLSYNYFNNAGAARPYRQDNVTWGSGCGGVRPVVRCSYSFGQGTQTENHTGQWQSVGGYTLQTCDLVDILVDSWDNTYGS
jgi:hypothetical protein